MKQFKLYLLLFSIIPAFIPCKSEKYTIVKMIPSKTEVRIGHNMCGVGDEFDDKDTIFWNNADTLIMNVLCNDKNCYAPRLTLFYPHDIISDDEFVSLHRFLFAKPQALVGYGTSYDTIHVYPYSQTFIHLFQDKEDCLYAHVANSNLTFELTPIYKQYFLSSSDFMNHETPITLEIYKSPYLKNEEKVKSLVVQFNK